MKELADAWLVVETRRSIKARESADMWVLDLSNYVDHNEFIRACGDLHPNETSPVFIYSYWENIPDRLITKMGLDPAFFEIREALARLEEDEIDDFLKWCETNGHDIYQDDALLLVTRYEDLIPPIIDYQQATEDDTNYEGPPYALSFNGEITQQFFDENYN